jgi:hypothetical protein
MNPDIEPHEMTDYTMAYDAKSDRVLLWGGYKGMDNVIWAYDYNTNTWTNTRYSKIKSTNGPVAAASPEMVYDPDTDLVYVYVGNQFLSYDYNNNQWQDYLTTPPGERHDFQLAYDPINKRLILFGGTHDYGTWLNDLWSFDPTTGKYGKWTLLAQ